MRPGRIAALALAVTTAVVGIAMSSSTADATAASPLTTRFACAQTVGTVHCNARVVTGGRMANGVTPNATTPSGLFPAQLQAAYNLPSATAGSGQTVAIVDAYDDPTAEADLGVYRAQFGLSACTTANGCFRKVNQTGGTSYPRKNGGWAEEISLDLDMVSAICPNCHILLVEATSRHHGQPRQGGQRGRRAGCHRGEQQLRRLATFPTPHAPYYNHPGVAITASSGDNGYGVEFPASSHYVTAVGGTSLTTASNSRGWTETAWSGAGSGCSTQNTALSGASSFGTGCSKRAVADVSAVADPNTGVAVYDSTAYQGFVGWLVFGGTSVSSPIIASVYASGRQRAAASTTTTRTHTRRLCST